MQALGTESATNHVAARIIDMAKDLNLRIIAEGVETEEQQRLLSLLAVDFVQGYLHDRPLPIERLLQRLRADRNSRLQNLEDDRRAAPNIADWLVGSRPGQAPAT